MDLSSFDFRTGKMLMSKLNKNRQRLRYDNNNQTKVRGLSSEVIFLDTLDKLFSMTAPLFAVKPAVRRKKNAE